MSIAEPISATTAADAPAKVKARKVKSGEPMGRSVAASMSSPKGRVVVILLVFLWTIPTFGVLVSSFRKEIDVKTTGWWQVFWKPSLTLKNYSSVLGSKSGGDNLAGGMNSISTTAPMARCMMRPMSAGVSR